MVCTDFKIEQEEYKIRRCASEPCLATVQILLPIVYQIRPWKSRTRFRGERLESEDARDFSRLLKLD